jgi:Ca2+-binding RTX toxin-like protein
MATPAKWGSEFLVNTITNGNQAEPVVKALADGRFVATWYDTSGTLGDNSGTPGAIHAQLFHADGSKSGAEFLVNTTTMRDQSDPAVTTLPNGGFVVAWRCDVGGDYDIRAQVFNPDGSKSGAELFVNTGTQSDQGGVDLATLADGRFVATWFSVNVGSIDIRAQIFNADGTKSGGEFHLDTPAAGTHYFPVIAGLLDPSGLPDGRFVAAWHDDTGADRDVHARIFNADGSKTGAEFVVNAPNGHTDGWPSIVALTGGRFVVAWSDEVNGTDNISARIFDAAGVPGSVFTVNTTADHQNGVTLTALADGGFAATWNDGTGGDLNIHAQVFDAFGGKSGGELLVNTTTSSVQADSSITTLADGRLVVSWWDQSHLGGDSSQAAVKAQILDPRDGAVNLSGTALNDDNIGTKYNDIMKGAGGDDRLDGALGLDTLKGGDGNDVLIGGGGSDTIMGDAGDDTAVFTQNLAKYSLTDFGNRIVVLGPDGADEVTSVEHLQFADGTVNPDDGTVLFDTARYMMLNQDVFHSGMNALDHFNNFGWHEGRDPNAYFDTSGYLGANKDVAASGLNPLDHYHQSGWHEGRDPSAAFDTTLYLINNPDVAAAGMDPLLHYLEFGINEGRTAYAAIGLNIVSGFDAEYYLFHNPDVAAAGVDPLAHYNTTGWHEGRNPNAWFDTAGYLAHYADVAAAGINPLWHYETVGWKEGRDPSAGFDTLKYLAANPDVAAAQVNPLDHFLQHGIYEGRSTMGDGIWH